MGMDPISWVIIGASAVSAYSSMEQGKAAEEEGRINAGRLRESAALIDVQKGVESAQYDRLSGQLMGTSVANIGASGGFMGGSYAAKMIDTQRQVAIDKALGQNALERDKRSALSSADAEERMGKYARRKGTYDAFSTMLSGAGYVGRYEGWGINTSGGAKG